MVATPINRNTAICFDPNLELPTVQIKKILLAEDDDDDFYLFNSAILSICGSLEILRSNNGAMLSSLMETSKKPDIIILDINMPFKNGILCLREIKGNPRLSSIKVVMYSTSGSNKDIDTCYKYGADFYLVKPISYASIVQQFKDLFSNEYFLTNQRPPREKFVLNNSLFYSF
ncbi:MAG: hypothetical protein JWQ40_5101 [Segetibacter sp.]|jgi:CheY-like chemotaxis protein|nr:hypothetical protein [Segetibacter sp.]